MITRTHRQWGGRNLEKKSPNARKGNAKIGSEERKRLQRILKKGERTNLTPLAQIQKVEN